GRKGTDTIATNMAGRGTDIKLTPEVKEAGGLAIIGTERHESRRVDRQLRGRAGRQGDPGSSVFFVSFEDQLMRLFATDSVVKMLDRLGLQEDEMIEHKIVNNAIEKAQKRVEENNFGIRKRLLEFDDVMNKQRTYIYERRRHAVLGERIGVDIINMLYDTVENIVLTYEQPADYADMCNEIFRVLAIEAPFTQEEYANMSREERVEKLHVAAVEALDRKSDRIREVAMPVITQMAENTDYNGLILVPITDGKRIFNLRVDLRTCVATECRSIIKEWHKALMLVTIDELWKEHLRELDQLRQSVQNAAYEQKDPLVIYKVESFHLFENMLSNLNAKAVSALMRGQIFVRQAPQAPNPTPQAPQDAHDGEPGPEQPRRPQPELHETQAELPKRQQYRESKAELPGQAEQRAAAGAPQGEREKAMPARSQKVVGRNDLCPCGSGKKFKNCHGKGM
ncbi:MAG: SEC-C domain-containing protein, partial [Muribaculaceae bacterium]|nr:SEC-C domain-containing protein [Muribaculaceae bacterium]